MRFFIGGLSTETNTFSPFPTGRKAFEEFGITRDASRNDGILSGPLRIWRSRAENDGHTVTEGITTFAQPSGKTTKPVYEAIRDEILSDLEEAEFPDVILLFLHGAMVAEGYDDCEGDLLRSARTLCPKAFIGAVLDPHCHLTHEMVEQSDMLILAKEYPHIDFIDRAEEIYDLAIKTVQKEIRPVAALLDTAMVGFYPTIELPMCGIVAELRESETLPGVLSASIAHGFPWADVADVGTRVLIYTDADPTLAANKAVWFGKRLYQARHELLPTFPDLDTALERQLGLNGRIVLGDCGDNPGGGAPGDSTFVLRALLDRGITDAAIGAIWDPFIAQTAMDAGVGARLAVRLGGKCGVTSGDPIDLDVEVMGICEQLSQGTSTGQRQPLGCSAWLHNSGIDILVCSIRTQIFAPDAFTGIGIPLASRRLVIVKSSNHYRAGFSQQADHLWNVATPGTIGLDLARLSYTKKKTIYFPKHDDPWLNLGEPVPLLKDAPNQSLSAHAVSLRR